MIQVVQLVSIGVRCIVEQVDIVLEVSPNTLHRAEVEGDRADEFALHGSVTDLLQALVGFLAQLRMSETDELVNRISRLANVLDRVSVPEESHSAGRTRPAGTLC